MRTSHGFARIERAARQVDAGLWKAAFAERCFDARYYEVIEEAFPDRFDFRYAILTNERSGQSVVQPFFLVRQEITAGMPERFRRRLAWVSRFLHVKMAVVGCVAGTGELACAEPWALEALDDVLVFCARQEHAAILLFKDFPAHYRALFAALRPRGYRRVPSMPSTALQLDFSNFEGYLQTRLGRGFRNHLRRKFRDSALMGRLTLEVVEDATPYLAEITPLYLQTHGRSAFQFEQLNAVYFSQLGRRMPERTRFFLWRREGRLLAFALCMVHGGVLHYLSLGMDYPEALTRHLYYVAWRDLVTWALDAGLQSIKAGQLNYEAKFRLGLRLAPRDLYARHVSPIAAPFFACALRFLQPARHDPALRQFPNADEL